MMTMSTMIQAAEALRSMNNLLPGFLSAPTAVVEIQMMMVVVMAVKQRLLRYLDDDILLVESYDVADVVDDELMMKVKE